MKIKRLLSIMLSISCVFNSIIPSRVFANDYCTARNSKGGYLHQRCADPELVKVGNNQENFVTVENLGPFGDEERYCFNFRALDDLYEKKKLISVAELRKERNKLDEVCETPIYDFATNITIGFTALLGAVGGYLFQMWPNYATTKGAELADGCSTSASSSRTPTPTRHEVNKPPTKSSVLPTCIGALISVLVSSIFFYFNGKKKKNDACRKSEELNHKIVEINKANERKADMLNLLLHAIDRPRELTFDMACFVSQPNNFYWDPKYVGINYTKEEMASFPGKFKEVAAKIRKNLKENGKLTRDNENGGKVTPGQGALEN